MSVPLPNVASGLRDTKTGVTFRVMAYRKLTDGEVREAIRYYLRQQPKPKHGETVTIYATHH